MKQICLQLYMYELQKHHGILLYEWLLEAAKKIGISGGFANRTLAGFGREGTLHEAHFFELGSNVPVTVTFYLKKEEQNLFLHLLKKEKLSLFYVVSEVNTGITDQLKSAFDQ
ncbi:MAG: DUF190 domain-containing protein [Chlamydiota bacterium]